MVVLPIRTVTRPAALVGTSNGRLPLGSLVEMPGQARGPDVLLIAPAARGWRAMCAAALQAGHTLKATSTSDSYRPYAVQLALFRARYSSTRIAGRPTKRWDGRTWWLRPGMATAAAPGTSNHGLGLAVDIGEEKDGDAGTESIDDVTVRWLVNNATRYGFSAELQSEPWHWRWYVGDRIPAAVLAFEAGTTPPPAPPPAESEDDDMTDVTDIRAWGLETVLTARRLEAAAAADSTRDALMLTAINALAAQLTSSGGGGNLDSLPIIAAIREEATRTRTEVERLQQAVEAKDAELDQLRARLAEVLTKPL